VLAALCALVAAVLVLRPKRDISPNDGREGQSVNAQQSGDKGAFAAQAAVPESGETQANGKSTPPTALKALPKLVDFGSHSCIPCKMMAPILEELKKEYGEVFRTEFIDVWQNAEAGRKYGIRLIPTQIFFDADGKELFRHEGFYSKEDILKKWKELGVDIGN